MWNLFGKKKKEGEHRTLQLITDKKISVFQDIVPLLESVIQSGRKLLISVHAYNIEDGFLPIVNLDEVTHIVCEVRQAGIETHVPRGGSVRSGAVDLFPFEDAPYTLYDLVHRDWNRCSAGRRRDGGGGPEPGHVRQRQRAARSRR